MSIYRRPSDGVPAGDAIPFAFDGVCHLFHLASPPGTVAYPDRVRTTWRHVRSRDLVSWEELPPALTPGEGSEPDANGVWTGSVIEADGVFHIFYTGYRLGASSPQTICEATSTDLVHFEKNPANPILVPDPAHFDAVDWRDPYVFWNDEEGLYWMLIAARAAAGPKWRRGCIVLATSPDLVKWSVEPTPLYAPANTYCPECPEMFPLAGRWYLVYSRFSENAATIYRVAEHPRGPWRAPAKETLDGRRWYAAKSLPRGDSRVFFGWVHDREGATDAGAWLWGGDFTAPREVIATDAGLLQTRLPGAVAASFGRDISFSLAAASAERPGSIKVGREGGFEWRLIEIPAADYLFTCRFQGGGAPTVFGLLLGADDELAGYAVVFDALRRAVALVRWPSPLDSFWSDLVQGPSGGREVDGPRLVEHMLDWSLAGAGVSCGVLVSGSIIEIYVNGVAAMSYRVYAGDWRRVGIFAEGAPVVCDAMTVRAAGQGA